MSKSKNKTRQNETKNKSKQNEIEKKISIFFQNEKDILLQVIFEWYSRRSRR